MATKPAGQPAARHNQASQTLTHGTHNTDKDTWINTERLRWARHFSVPMTPGLPPDFPANTLPIMRALCGLAELDAAEADAAAGQGQGKQDNQPRLTKALDEFYSQYWEHAVATHKPEVLRETMVRLFGEAEAEKSECLFFFLPFSVDGLRRLAWCLLRALPIISFLPPCLALFSPQHFRAATKSPRPRQPSTSQQLPQPIPTEDTFPVTLPHPLITRFPHPLLSSTSAPASALPPHLPIPPPFT